MLSFFFFMQLHPQRTPRYRDATDRRRPRRRRDVTVLHRQWYILLHWHQPTFFPVSFPSMNCEKFSSAFLGHPPCFPHFATSLWLMLVAAADISSARLRSTRQSQFTPILTFPQSTSTSAKQSYGPTSAPFLPFHPIIRPTFVAGKMKHPNRHRWTPLSECLESSHVAEQHSHSTLLTPLFKNRFFRNIFAYWPQI